MSEQENSALARYIPRAQKREVSRHVGLMRAKEEVTDAVIDSGKEIHEHAVKSSVEMAHFDHLMLQGAAQNLNGVYKSLEDAINRQRENDFEFVFQTTVQAKTSLLRQAESMPIVPEKGAIAQLGDGLAKLLDELDSS